MREIIRRDGMEGRFCLMESGLKVYIPKKSSLQGRWWISLGKQKEGWRIGLLWWLPDTEAAMPKTKGRNIIIIMYTAVETVKKIILQAIDSCLLLQRKRKQVSGNQLQWRSQSQRSNVSHFIHTFQVCANSFKLWNNLQVQMPKLQWKPKLQKKIKLERSFKLELI